MILKCMFFIVVLAKEFKESTRKLLITSRAHAIYFYSLSVVGRGIGTQLQVDTNLNTIS